MSNLLPAELKRFPLLCLLIALLVALMFAVEIVQPHYRFNLGVYVPLHTAMHVFSLVVSWLVFAIGWNTHDPERAGSITLLACGFLGVALLDFGHALSYPGMPDLVTPASPTKSINFSLVSRSLAALALLAIAFVPRKPLAAPSRGYIYLFVALALVTLVYWAVLFRPEIFPQVFVPGSGLTPFKISIEYIIVGVHVLAAAGFYRQLRTSQSANAGYLLAASVVMALSQAMNALYSHPYDVHNFISHVYRVIGYMLIYRGIFISEMREPYNIAEHLQSELRDSAMRLRQMGARMQHDVEQERKRISHSLHDEMGQNLTALQLDVGWIRRHCSDDPGMLEVADRMQRSVEDSAASMRRIVADMRPRVLDDLGIIAAIKSLVKDISTRSGIEITFTPKGELDDIGEATKTALYRMLQECLTNITRHARAGSAQVLLIAGEQDIEMLVRRRWLRLRAGSARQTRLVRSVRVERARGAARRNGGGRERPGPRHAGGRQAADRTGGRLGAAKSIPKAETQLQRTIEILVVDDHQVVREGLKRILAEAEGCRVSAEAGNVADALAWLRKRPFDLMLLDISLPERTGLELLKMVKQELPKLPVLVLSAYREDHYAVRALKDGADGYLNKESASDSLIAAIRKVTSGGKYLTPALAERIALELGTRDDKRPLHEGLSEREFQILKLIARGVSLKDIARATPHQRQNRDDLPRAHPRENERDEQCGADPLHAGKQLARLNLARERSRVGVRLHALARYLPSRLAGRNVMMCQGLVSYEPITNL